MDRTFISKALALQDQGLLATIMDGLGNVQTSDCMHLLFLQRFGVNVTIKDQFVTVTDADGTFNFVDDCYNSGFHYITRDIFRVFELSFNQPCFKLTPRSLIDAGLVDPSLGDVCLQARQLIAEHLLLRETGADYDDDLLWEHGSPGFDGIRPLVFDSVTINVNDETDKIMIDYKEFSLETENQESTIRAVLVSSFRKALEFLGRHVGNSITEGGKKYHHLNPSRRAAAKALLVGTVRGDMSELKKRQANGDIPTLSETVEICKQHLAGKAGTERTAIYAQIYLFSNGLTFSMEPVARKKVKVAASYIMYANTVINKQNDNKVVYLGVQRISCPCCIYEVPVDLMIMRPGRQKDIKGRRTHPTLMCVGCLYKGMGMYFPMWGRKIKENAPPSPRKMSDRKSVV